MPEQFFNALDGIPRGGQMVLGILAVVQLSLQVACLVDLRRRRQVRYGRKWVWLLVIALGQVAGAVAYLAVARLPQTVEDQSSPPEAVGGRAQRALDVLYRQREDVR